MPRIGRWVRVVAARIGTGDTAPAADILNEPSLARRAAATLAEGRRESEADDERPNVLSRALMWGGGRPIVFASLVGLGCLLLSIAFLPAARPEWVVFQFPKLPDDYSHATFFGTIWTVQATFIALVYPIVLTFVPILLQRRPSSRFALAFYMRGSAVLPAGTSSLLLLGVLSLQYVLSYYIPQNLFLFGAVFDGTWLVCNLVLTAYFLVKTVRYVEEEVGESTYRRLSLSYVLWSDLQDAVLARDYDSAASKIGPKAGRSARLGPRPQVKKAVSDQRLNCYRGLGCRLKTKRTSLA